MCIEQKCIAGSYTLFIGELYHAAIELPGLLVATPDGDHAAREVLREQVEKAWHIAFADDGAGGPVEVRHQLVARIALTLEVRGQINLTFDVLRHMGLLEKAAQVKALDQEPDGHIRRACLPSGSGLPRPWRPR